MTTTRKAGLAPVLGLAALSLAAVPQAHAQTTITAVSVTSQAANGSGYFSMGFTFTPTQNLYVTAVGALNNGAVAHNVQIYQVDSATKPTTGTSVIGQVSVPTTTNDTTGSSFTYTSLAAPVLLTSGTAYEIVESINGTYYYANPSGGPSSNLTTNNITVGGGFYTSTSSMTATATPVATGNPFLSSNQGPYDPNFKFSLVNPAVTPEPSQFASFGLGLLGLSGLALKARKRRPTSV